MDKLEATSIIISEGLEYVRELNSLYSKALDDAAEMFSAITKTTKGEAFIMFFGDNFTRFDNLVESLKAVREMAQDLR